MYAATVGAGFEFARSDHRRAHTDSGIGVPTRESGWALMRPIRLVLRYLKDRQCPPVPPWRLMVRRGPGFESLRGHR
jgi:hypothetical protein